MSDDNPKWESKREKFVTCTAVIIIIGTLSISVITFFVKDYETTKNLAILLDAFTGAALGWLFGYNTTKESEVKAREDKNKLAEGGAQFLAKIEEQNGVIESLRKKEQGLEEIIKDLTLE